MARVTTVAVTSVHKTRSRLNRRSGRDDERGVGDESCSVRAQGSSFSTPGFTPGSLPVLLPIPDPTQSHSVALVQANLLIVSMRISFMVALHLTLSLSPLIALLRRGSWVRVPAGSPFTIKHFRELLLSQHRSKSSLVLNLC